MASPSLHHFRGFLTAANGHEPFLDGINKRVKVKLYMHLCAASFSQRLVAGSKFSSLMLTEDKL